MSTTQRLPKLLATYQSLPAEQKRLVTKLINAMSNGEIDDKTCGQIRRSINRNKKTDRSGHSNGYLVFYKENYPNVKQRHKDWKVTEIAKYIGEEWSKLSESDKTLYREQALQVQDNE